MPIRSHSRLTVLAVAAAAALLGALPIAAQSVNQIFEEVIARDAARLAGVNDLTIVQEVMGLPTTIRMVKEMVDGRPVLRVHSAEAGLLGGVGADQMGSSAWTDIGGYYAEAADRWRLEGRGEVDGRSTHRLLLDDLEGLDIQPPVPSDEVAMTFQSLEMELDEERLVPLRMTMVGEVIEDGAARPATIVVTMSDYREVDGYLHPFLTVMETDMASAGVTPEQAEQARQGIEEMRRQLEQVPEAQRQMIEQMLGPQMEMMQNMLQGDRLRLELRVTELRVNAGLP